MSYYRECIRCGAALDPGEVCDCDVERENLIAEACSLFIQLPPEKRREYLAELKTINKNAALVLEHQNGKAEQIDRPVSASIV